jgi:hypothetical protein
MTKKNDNGKTSDQERNELFIQQLKIVALNSRLDALMQRQQALVAESNLIAVRKPEMERERSALLSSYQTRYEQLKKTLEVPEGHELNLETGEVVASQA